MKLKVEGDHLEYADLYMGDHMVNNPNYPDTDRNCDRIKYNCQFLGVLTIVTTKVIEVGKKND